jgi:hypothetical protein
VALFGQNGPIYSIFIFAFCIASVFLGGWYLLMVTLSQVTFISGLFCEPGFGKIDSLPKLYLIFDK